jgi:hypothetical protein
VAKISVEYDTVTKALTCASDGQPLPGALDEVSFREEGVDPQGRPLFRMCLCRYVRDDAQGTRDRVVTYAARADEAAFAAALAAQFVDPRG